jgi:hypothetical protein
VLKNKSMIRTIQKVKKKTNLKASASELGAFANLSPVEQRKFPKLTI